MGRVQTLVSRIQLATNQESDDSGAEVLDEASGAAPDEEEQTATDTYDADSLAEEVRVFNPILNLQCVQDYMEVADASDEGFCPDYTVIPRSGSGNIDNELSLIDADQNQARAESIYLTLRDALVSPLLGIFQSRYRIAFTADVFDTTVDLMRNFNRLYGLSDRYREVHEILGVDDDVLPLAFGCDYYEGSNVDIDEGPYCLVYHQIDARYRIQGATLYFNTLIVNTTDYENDQRDVTYRGFLELDHYFGVLIDDLAAVDQEIPIEMVTSNSDIESNFDAANPEFVIDIMPNDLQIDIDILLRNLFRLNEVQVDAPKGLSSVRRLSVNFAHIGVMNGETIAASIRSTSPDFDFLSEHVGISNVNYRLHFRGNSDYESTFTGTSNIGSVTFDTILQMTASDIDYLITLTDNQDQTLNYFDISSIIIPTISTTEAELQPDNASSYALDNLEINELELNLSRPNITMSFRPYMLYTIEGFHDTNGDDITDSYARITYADIDGAMLIHNRYLFDYGRSQSIFNAAFEIEEIESAFNGLTMTSLVFNTYNRDFDFTGYQEYSSVQNDTMTHWERGTNVTINAELHQVCGVNAFCHFLKNRAAIENPMVFHGIIENDVSTFSHRFNETVITPYMNLTNSKADIIVIEHEVMLQVARVRGDLKVLIEPERHLFFNSYLRFSPEDDTFIDLDGESNTIYENIFSMNNVLDIIDANFTGYLNATANLTSHSILSYGVLGQNCYANRVIFDALTTQSENQQDGNAYDFDRNDEDLTSFIDSENCRVGNVNLTIGDDVMQNTINAHFDIFNVSDVLMTILNSNDGESLPSAIREISLDSGITFEVTYAEVDPNQENLDRHIDLISLMTWYGIQNYGGIN